MEVVGRSTERSEEGERRAVGGREPYVDVHGGSAGLGSSGDVARGSENRARERLTRGPHLSVTPEFK